MTQPAQANILVVEDEDVVRRILVALITDLGHLAVEARDGEEAVELLTRSPPDLIITDKNLPGISGLDVLKVARQRCPDAELMMVTGYASYESALEALRLGVCEYMEKPFLDLRAIQQRVQHALATRQRNRPTPHALAQRLVDLLQSSSDAAASAALPHALAALKALS